MTRHRFIRSSCSGFTLVEIVLVVAIVGILANLVVPELREVMRRGHAAAIIADFTTVRRAVVEYARDNNEYPEESQAGFEPRGLGLYLRGGLRWSSVHSGASYDWENWISEDGTPLFEETGIGYGLSVVSEDVRLLDTVDENYDGWTKRLWGNRLIFVVEGLSGDTGASEDDDGDDDDGDDDDGNDDDGNNGNGNNGNGNGGGNGNGNNGNGNGNGGGNGNGNNGNGNGNGGGNGSNGNGNGNNGNRPG